LRTNARSSPLPNDDDREWLERARCGEFSSMPEEFDFDRYNFFAHLIDGYRLAQQEGRVAPTKSLPVGQINPYELASESKPAGATRRSRLMSSVARMKGLRATPSPADAASSIRK